MAIQQGLCSVFRADLLRGVHNFYEPGGYALALYTSAAELGPATEEYSTEGEVVGGGYVAGGVTLTCLGVYYNADVAVVDFADVVFSYSDYTTRGALLYHVATGKAVAVLDFGSDKTPSTPQGEEPSLHVDFPTPTATGAIIRIGTGVAGTDVQYLPPIEPPELG